MSRLILASTSQRRKELLTSTGLSFDIVPSHYEEDMTIDLPPTELAMTLSHGKAVDVAQRYPDAVVIGVDTFAEIDGILLGKPKTIEDAHKTLATLSGKTHVAVTGFTIIHKKENKLVSKSVETKVTFKVLSDKVIDDYVQDGHTLPYAGSYTLAEVRDTFVESIEGSESNILGFPLEQILQELQAFGISV